MKNKSARMITQSSVPIYQTVSRIINNRGRRGGGMLHLRMHNRGRMRHRRGPQYRSRVVRGITRLGCLHKRSSTFVHDRLGVGYLSRTSGPLFIRFPDPHSPSLPAQAFPPLFPRFFPFCRRFRFRWGESMLVPLFPPLSPNGSNRTNFPLGSHFTIPI